MKISHILSKENNNLDLIRILLAILVMVIHTAHLNGKSELWVDPFYMFNFTDSGSTAVMLFFFISGLVVTNSYLKKNDVIYYIISRIFRILPLLFFVLIITVFIFGPILTTFQIGDYFSSLGNFSYIWKNLIFDTQYNLPGVFNNNIYKDAVNGSLWSLKYEMGCYIALLLFFLIRNNNKFYLNIPIVLVLLDSFFSEGLLYHYLGRFPAINLTPFAFALGALFAVNSNLINVNIKTVIFTIIVFYIFRDTPQNHVLYIVCAATIVIYISSHKFFLKFKPKYDVSYGVYVWSFIIQQALYQFLGHMHPGIHFLVAIIISFSLAFTSYIFIEKPFMILGKKLYNRYKNYMLN